MRTFCSKRRVPRALRRGAYAWVSADQEVSLLRAASSIAARLPHLVRVELLVHIHAPLVDALRTSLADAAIGELVVRLSPAVCLRDHVLLEEGHHCETLYLLVRGALRVSTTGSTLSAQPDAPGAGGARGSRASRQSGSGMRKLLGDHAISAACAREVAAAYGGGGRQSNRQQSVAADPSRLFTAFRILERTASLVGLSSARPGAARARLPFSVEAQRHAQLQSLDRPSLVRSRPPPAQPLGHPHA
jgi:hypothetical protein